MNSQQQLAILSNKSQGILLEFLMEIRHEIVKLKTDWNTEQLFRSVWNSSAVRTNKVCWELKSQPDRLGTNVSERYATGACSQSGI